MKFRARGVFTPKILIPFVAAGGIAFGTVGLLRMLERTGEAAIGFIPADAIVAVSFDNVPSASQVPLFNRISRAMEESGLNGLIDEGLLEADQGRGILREARSYLKGSFAFGAWKSSRTAQEPEALLALALNDPAGAENLVRRYTRKFVKDGITFYQGEKADEVLAFYEGYALVSNSKLAIKKALSVATGKEPSLFAQDSFKRARASLPEDASFMAFLNGKAITEQDADAKKGFEALGLDAQGWLALGVSLREEGIQIDGTLPTSALQSGMAAALREMPPVTFASLRDYPEGAMGVAGLSSPARIIEVLLEAASMTPNEKAQVDKGIAEMEQQTGMSFRDEWLPAFRGEFNMAVYPEGRADPGVIISLDNSNGGTATQTALKLLDILNSGALDSPSEQPRFVETTIGQYSVFRPASPKQNEESAVVVSSHGVFFVSNERLLNALVSGQRSGSSLLESNRLAPPLKSSSKFSLVLDLETIISVMENQNEIPEGVNLRQIITQPQMEASWDINADSAHFKLLIPVDIPELINTIGRQARKEKI